MTKQFLSTTEAAQALSSSKPTVLRVCKANPGFAFRFGGMWKIPAEHIARLKAGASVAQIAAAARGVAA